MREDLISVIVPVYNVEKYLDRCVRSLLNQTYTNIEIILIDDGSPDKCPQICDSYAEQYEKVRVFHKQNGGLGSARNAGLRLAEGAFVSFVDSDDWLEEDTYEYMMSLIATHNADVADIMCIQTSDENMKAQQPEEVVKVFKGVDILKHYLQRGLAEQNGAPFSVCRKLYKKEILQDILFDEHVVSEDTCFNYKALSRSNVEVVSNYRKYYYFQNNSSSITSGALRKKDLTLLEVTEELIELARVTNDKEIIDLAVAKRARSDFSLLAKAAVGGMSDNITDDDISALIKGLKRNLLLLLKSPIPINRKILCISFALNYKLSTKMIQFVKKMKN